MLIVTADDLGRSAPETDAALRCYASRRITSGSAMVFMKDSSRAADLALGSGIQVGLHLNLSESFTGSNVPRPLRDRHEAIVRFLTLHKYALVLCNPFLARSFKYVYEAQLDEFSRLYGRRPSHIDGHQHRHLCSNILAGGLIPDGERVRRNFSYGGGEKSVLNRMYRRAVDRHLERKYVITDFFFGLLECLQTDRMPRVFHLAREFRVELMTHPVKSVEAEYLMGDDYWAQLAQLRGTLQCSLP